MTVIRNQIKEIQKLSKDLKILVIGDVMIDRYYLGTVNRISPEAPVPVLDWHKTNDLPGGASNVALNLIKLNCHVSLISVLGQDHYADIIENQMNEIGVNHFFIKEKNRITTIKSRFISDHQQLLRLDQEDKHDIDSDSENFILSKLQDLIANGLSTIILQDYNKGIFTKQLIGNIINIANQNKIPICVDPKKSNFFEFQGVTLFKPNLKEANTALNFSTKNFQNLFHSLAERIDSKLIMITLASEGLILGDKQLAKIFPTKTRLVKDVSGAGDTVISIASICVACHTDSELMAEICNIAGGIVCEIPGVASITWEDILDDLDN